MAGLSDTPAANRIHIAFFGLRNAGKSTLVNAFTGQDLAIVSDTPGTTTDPVSKAMEILPLGPCLVTDTAGLDDVGELGAMRVRKTLAVLDTTDIAVWVASADSAPETAAFEVFSRECQKHSTAVLLFRRGDSVDGLKQKISSVRLNEVVPGLLDGLVKRGDSVICVCPIDESAPKSRLILPQVQVIRDCLDRGAMATVCQPAQLLAALSMCRCEGVGAEKPLVITDSQAFGEVKRIVSESGRDVRLTSFSVLFARQKGDLSEYARGMAAIRNLQDGEMVLIAEGCTHHRQCNDIGSVKIPKALAKLSGRKLRFEFASGASGFERVENVEGVENVEKVERVEKVEGVEVLSQHPQHPQHSQLSLIRQSKNLKSNNQKPSLIVHCGGCMLTRREMLRRIRLAADRDIPIVNYGLVLAAANGIDLDEVMV